MRCAITRFNSTPLPLLSHIQMSKQIFQGEYKKYKRGMSTRLSGPSWSVPPTQREKLTYCPETVLASVRRQFIFVHSLTRTRSSPCHEVFSSVLADLALCSWIPSQRKEVIDPRAPSLDAAHQFTLSQVALWEEE